MPRMKTDSTTDAAITSNREKPRWKREGSGREGMTDAGAFHPLEKDRVRARGGVASVWRRRVAEHDGAAFARGTCGRDPARRRDLAGGHGAGAAVRSGDGRGAGISKNRPHFEIDGGIA